MRRFHFRLFAALTFETFLRRNPFLPCFTWFKQLSLPRSARRLLRSSAAYPLQLVCFFLFTAQILPTWCFVTFLLPNLWGIPGHSFFSPFFPSYSKQPPRNVMSLLQASMMRKIFVLSKYRTSLLFDSAPTSLASSLLARRTELSSSSLIPQLDPTRY